MKLTRVLSLAACSFVYFLIGFSGWAADYPSPREGDWVLRDFRFHTGEILPELKLHYMTIGAPSGEPVLVLHGSTASGQTMLTNDFAGELFGTGQPLDASRWDACTPGCGARCIRISWTHWCRWRPCRSRWRAATG